MSACFTTGGPDWLFPLMLGSGLAACTCLLLLASPPPGAPFRRSPWRLVPGLGAAGVSSWALGEPFADLLPLFAPIVLACGVLGLVSAVGSSVSTAGGSVTLVRRPRVIAIALGALAGATALAALLASIVQGGPC